MYQLEKIKFYHFSLIESIKNSRTHEAVQISSNENLKFIGAVQICNNCLRKLIHFARPNDCLFLDTT
jgi:hypothetical protein